MLYECNEAEVPLTKEAEIIKNYIELEKMRYGNRLDVSLNISGDVGSKLIAPLLLLPFLENSFKHGTSNQIDQCWISLDLRVEGDTMKFKLINSRSNVEDNNIAGGLGLSNAKKRLELLYPSRYNLKLIPDEETFTVSLVMQLNSTVNAHSSTTIVTPNNHRYENEMPVSG
jgi:LytS/YehU family sensor histidine kinase